MWWFILLLLMMIFNAFFPVAIASPLKTKTINPYFSGNIQKSHGNYTLAWSASTGDSLFNSSEYSVFSTGEWIQEDNYKIYRAFFKFDTSFLKSFSDIRDVTLEIDLSAVLGNWTPIIQIWNDTDNEFTLADYSAFANTNYAYEGATSDNYVLTVPLQRSVIHKAQDTALCLRVAPEVDGQKPPDGNGHKIKYFCKLQNIELTITYFRGARAGDPPENSPWSPVNYCIAGASAFLSSTPCSKGDKNK